MSQATLTQRSCKASGPRTIVYRNGVTITLPGYWCIADRGRLLAQVANAGVIGSGRSEREIHGFRGVRLGGRVKGEPLVKALAALLAD